MLTLPSASELYAGSGALIESRFPRGWKFSTDFVLAPTLRARALGTYEYLGLCVDAPASHTFKAIRFPAFQVLSV